VQAIDVEPTSKQPIIVLVYLRLAYVNLAYVNLAYVNLLVRLGGLTRHNVARVTISQAMVRLHTMCWYTLT